jgi:hypothetical protein
MLVLLGISLFAIMFFSAGLATDGVYADYLKANSASYRRMDAGGQSFYIFLMWLFTPVWLVLILVKVPIQAFMNFCGAFLGEPRQELDLDALKKEIEDLCKNKKEEE